MKFCYRLHESGSDTILAVADHKLVGTALTDGKRNVVVSKEFYGEDVASAEEIVSHVKRASIVNALGNDIVELLLKNGAVKKEEIVEVCGVMHAQIVAI